MSLLSLLHSFGHRILHRQLVDNDLDDEIRSQLDLMIDQKMKEGVTLEEARRAAKVELGGVEQVKEQVRSVRTGAWLDSLLQDIRFGLRMLCKNPGFTIAAVLTLGLGIGANTAIFSIVDAVLLRPLPFKDGSRLAVMNETTPKVGTVSVSYPDFLDWRTESRTFSEMAAVNNGDFNLSGITQPENITGDSVSATFLSLLGMRPLLGRDFSASEDKSGTAPVVLLSFSLWQSHFGGDPGAVGRTIALDGRSFSIVGVLPRNFRWIDQPDVLLPIGVWVTGNDDASRRAERGDLIALGRLASGATVAAAQGEMNGIAAQIAKEYPASNEGFGALVTPLRNEFVGDARLAILVLSGAVIFVLLIACANVGKRFEFSHPRQTNDWITIVGVVSDTKLYGLANPARLEVYLPFRRYAPSKMDLVVKTGVEPEALTSAVRGIIAGIDRDQPLFDISTMDGLMSKSIATQRTTLILLGAFSGLALVLAAIGIYGVMSYSVGQRTREIGVRVALGALTGDVMRMVLIQGAKIAAFSVAIGLVASLVLTRLMSKLLYGVDASDPGTLAGAAAVLTIVALAACYIPARRAMRVDPMVALRHD